MDACHDALTALLIFAVSTATASAAGDATRGAKLFQACGACHSLEPGRNMTGPSLHGVWERKAGTAPGFIRYSDALKRSGVVWNEGTLDSWLKNPAQFIPGNEMRFAGVPGERARNDLIAYLKLASEGKSPAAGGGGMMGGGQMHNLKQAEQAFRVTAVRHCKDSYFVTTQDGAMHSYWEPNLRFKTDSSDIGPARGHPVILPAGMMGDRASLFFSDPDEISSFIKKQC
jgi:cytochrome c